MTKILTLLIISLVLAYLSEKNIFVVRCHGKRIDLALIALIVVLSLFCGLRTRYNDTENYIVGFRATPMLESFLTDPPSLFGNPAFHLFTSVFRYLIIDNYHAYFLTIAFFCISIMVKTIKRYSDSFVFSILLFFCLGLYISNLAAVKQCIAIAILMISIPKLLERKYIQFYLLVFIAMLFHTYALMFVIAPLFLNRPWSLTTYLSIAVILELLITFDSSITAFLELADTVGKELSDEIVLETEGINILRLAVFSVPVALSFLCRKRLGKQITQTDYFMINMSIFSFLVMSLGIYSGANLFGRSAHYFVFGALIALPWMVKKIFTRTSARTVLFIAAMFYMVFFWYGNQAFDASYSSISFSTFINTFFA